MVKSLVTFVISVYLRQHWILLQALMSLSIYRIYLYGKCHLHFTKSFGVVIHVLRFTVYRELSYLSLGDFSSNCAKLKYA